MSALIRETILLTCAFFTASTIAHADPIITASGSTTASGIIGASSFTNSLVTFTATFNMPSEFCYDYTDPTSCTPFQPGYYYAFDSQTADVDLDVTISIAGLGTFEDTGGDYVDFLYNNPPNLSSIQLVELGDLSGKLTLSSDLNEYLGDNCYDNLPFFYCPIFAQTSGGELILDSSDGSFNTNVQVSTNQTPEPDTLLLTATGLLGCVNLARRRILRTRP